MRELLSVEKYEGYEIRKERYTGQEAGLPAGESMVMLNAYTPEGYYIGDWEFAEHLIVTLGIKPELADTDHHVASIGFYSRDQRWYGWSHRAMCGFGIGDMLFDAEFNADDDTPFVQRGFVEIETLEEARQAAVNFADYVAG